MKKFDTEYMSNKKADLEELKVIIKNLFTEDSEEWLCLFDTDRKNPNYIQIHSDIEDYEDEAANFIASILNFNKKQMDEIEGIYLIECRKYDNRSSFKHYRAFFDNAEIIISYFEKYMNDEEIDVEKWIDVTEEFLD